jgi:uncharacterized membrane protein
MDGLDWVFSAVLAVVFLIVGVVHAFRYDVARKRFPWVEDVPRVLVTVIGIVEILGAVGLILPAATGIYPWLTAVAAIALGILMIMASQFHLRRRENTEATLSLVLLGFLIFVAYVRWPLLPS